MNTTTPDDEEDGDIRNKPDTPDDTEQQAYEEFVRNHAALQYRGWLRRLYDRWRYYRMAYFDAPPSDRGPLTVPHISIGRTAPRRLAETLLTTNYGGRLDVVLAQRVVFGTDRKLIRASDPALSEGVWRFSEDLLLGEVVKQAVLEWDGTDEAGYGGRGPRYAQRATPISEALGLGPVEYRRWSGQMLARPVAAFWPWAFRDPGYYLGHVSFDHLKLDGLTNREPVGGALPPGMAEYLLFLAQTNQVVRQIDVLGRMIDARTAQRSPAVEAFERSPHDPSGMPLTMPVIDPAWLTWNGGCVRAIAEGIRTRRAFDGMPILADALQDAGCEDDVLLNHCRALSEHTANCWALKLLTEQA